MRLSSLGRDLETFGRIVWKVTAQRGVLDRKLAAITLPSAPILVLGSAPGSQRPAGFGDHWTIVSVNASQARLDDWGVTRSPDLTIFRGNMLAQGEEHQAGVWRELAGRSTGHVLALAANDGEWLRPDDLLQRGYTTSGLTMIDYADKGAILLTQAGTLSLARTGRRTNSQGVLAIALALRLGGAPVVVAGMSLDNSHAFYARGGPPGRDHAQGDRTALRNLVRRHRPVFAAERAFADASGLPLWHGQTTVR